MGHVRHVEVVDDREVVATINHKLVLPYRETGRYPETGRYQATRVFLRWRRVDGGPWKFRDGRLLGWMLDDTGRQLYDQRVEAPILPDTPDDAFQPWLASFAAEHEPTS